MRSLISCVAVVAMIIASSVSAEGGEYVIEPAFAISEEYDDNIYLDPVNEVPDYITHLVPSIHATYSAPYWDWNIDYSYDYRYYARHGYENDDEQKLDLLGKTRIVPDLLYFDVRDKFGRTSTTPIRDYTQETPVKNQTDYNAFDLNPYTVFHVTSSMTLTAGYQYRNVWYRDPAAVDRTVHSIYGDLGRNMADRTSITASARSDRTETWANTRTRTKLLLGVRHEYQEASFLWGSVGATTTYEEGERRQEQPVWDAGITSLMSSVTARLETGRSYVEDPVLVDLREDRYLASIRMEKARTYGQVSLGLRNYGTELVTTERKRSAGVDFGHYLTERLQGRYWVIVDRYDRFPADAPDTVTVVYTTDVRFDYHASNSFTVSLGYRYIDSYSAAVYFDNYDVNRVFLEARKTF